MDLARANLLDYDIPLRMIGKMAANDQNIMFVPTSVAFKKLEFLSDILSNTAAFGLFEVCSATNKNWGLYTIKLCISGLSINDI